ncbi:MAG: hypothetical protein LKG26_00590 [Saccharofermentans sp.]|jgi:hypothetical protein|nr:hypothetical protein [Mageeibacillus sp.]MCI1264754.1 hypothetical protein [Saccharofermentans sp.]MCI1274581.1 hypothetical protein [Saccharofermentans sp.]MCI2043867.1 hypothetical protein [Mageeibacillus sp.]
MALGRVGKPHKKAVYGTTEYDVERRRNRIYVICAVLLVICGVLDVYFIIGILGL